MSATLTRFLICALLLLGSNLCFGQSRAAESLLRQAEELDRAGKLDAATAAYQRAERAFNQANDYNGRQKAMTALAALSERQANQLLSSVGASEMASTAPASAAPAAAPAAAAPSAPVASPAPADKAASSRPAAPAARLR
ncbi:hypothetical protein [Hymenobacter jeollabukensis]|uniref:DUF4398 domain-containing protein n=1 Tax=Hymenobacter jeollabukensis TaxID=2025313 RepID=A0A5R8WXF2_9BACT|nr:hypothetical protein [Hymenobacter jeollabukensis]TLM97049.1 hypothetical protein FDY95_03400 [Hymenobacter jeollabukensis]